jgi:hypothetical protein
MPAIIAYQKHITQQITRELSTPDGATELATLADGTTYVCLPDGATLPDVQPTEIIASINLVTLTDALRAEIKAASPHVRLINQRVVERVRARYSMEDEIKMIRLAPSPESTIYNDYVEACREWGREQKAALGL